MADVRIDDSVYLMKIQVISDRLMRYDLIIGADFLRTVEILIKNETLTLKPSSDSGLLKLPEVFQIDYEHEANKFDTAHLDDKNKDALENMIRNYTPNKIRDVNVKMRLVLKDNEPVYQRARRCSEQEKQIIKTQIGDWMREGVVRPSLSEYASPVVLVKKKNDTYRLCVDYRRLNVKIIKDRYPLPLIDDQLDQLQSARIFTTLDFENGFFHVEVDEDSRKYTAFITPDGQYEFLKMPLVYVIRRPFSRDS